MDIIVTKIDPVTLDQTYIFTDTHSISLPIIIKSGHLYYQDRNLNRSM